MFFSEHTRLTLENFSTRNGSTKTTDQTDRLDNFGLALFMPFWLVLLGIRAHTWPGSSALAGALSSGSYITRQSDLIRFLLTAPELRRQREEEERFLARKRGRRKRKGVSGGWVQAAGPRSRRSARQVPQGAPGAAQLPLLNRHRSLLLGPAQPGPALSPSPSPTSPGTLRVPPARRGRDRPGSPRPGPGRCLTRRASRPVLTQAAGAVQTVPAGLPGGGGSAPDPHLRAPAPSARMGGERKKKNKKK